MKWINTWLIAGPALLAAPVFAAETPDPAKVEEGREAYESYCSACHGVGMENPVEGARNLKAFPNDEFDRWKEIVAKGKGDMPAWEDILEAHEYDQIWYYVASRAGTEPIPEQKKAAAVENEEAKFVAMLAEDGGAEKLGKKGHRLYEQICSHCHGVNLVTSGVSSYDLRKYPADRYDDWKLAVKNGKGDMPAWGDILYPKEYPLLWYYITTEGGKKPFPGFGAAAEQQSAAPAEPELATEGTLTACLARNGGAMSRARVSGGTGFDYDVIREVADRMGVDLKITWFESEKDEHSSPLNQTYAMLAYGLCDIAPAHPIADRTFGPPRRPRSMLPYWTDRPTNWDLATQVDLKPVAVTQPYMFAGLGIVLGPDAGKTDLTSLDELKGLRVGTQQGTLAEAILRRAGPRSIQENVVTVPPDPKFLWEMELGKFDAALVDVSAFDFHKRQNAISKLTLTSYRHELGMNIGMSVLEDRPGLLATVDAALTEMKQDGALLKIARKQKVNYMAPRSDAPMDLGRAVMALGQ